ncbi:parallel beta helix pectate lyase-like protein [Jejuia pallidilutea]|uniref:Parallel beta helix pectate lyase-like protein n=1 Tax=Jejuia pallidilutea TaxID=504487 RepID=A0A362X6Z0_9FLAO|nr:right-handed parallel beta-helix repeat-containing protein [Jejuia pallidilutea]PQV51506.1 parallel beta helix pectate lyase-like protein [Jejuia pallidilutea]
MSQIFGKIKSLTIFIYTIGILSVSAQKQITYYISPTGNDTNPGTIELPFETIEKAKNTIAKHNGKNAKNITVFLRGGLYPVKETIVFNNENSGNKNTTITYSAYKNENPILSGGIVLNKWKNTKDGLWQMHIPNINFRQLYVNGKRAVRARTPNIGSYHTNLLWDVKAQEILIDSRLIKPWNNFKNVEMVINMNWAEAFMRLDSYTESNDEAYTWHTPTHARVKVQNPERNLVFKRFYPPKKNELAWYFENAYEFIDEPGEWYYDQATEMLYYHPLANEKIENAKAVIPRLETLILIKGNANVPITNLHFEGITFKHSTWLKPSKSGALNMQACNYSIEPTLGNVQFVERIPAAVKLEYAQFCSFENNIFSQLGASAIDLFDGTKNCLLNYNVFNDISANAIQLARFSDPKTEIHIPYNPKDISAVTEHHMISNNKISDIGKDYTGAVGIACGYGRNITIDHNEIFDLPYSGISVGWGWTSEKNIMENNRITGNLIYNVCQTMSDGGAIYTLSAQPGTIIKNNYIHDVKHADWAGKSHNTGIYLDEGSKGILIENNVIENVADGVPFILKGESVFKNNQGIPNTQVKQEAGILK